MGKNLDKLGTLDDFQAPWETASGETDIDKPKLRRWIYNLLKDKAGAQDARDEANEKVKAAEKERDETKAELEAKGDPDLQKELEAERAKTAKEKERADKAERQNLVNEVAADKGLSPAQAKRLQGSTKEELESDADDLLKTFGVEGKTAEEDEGEEDEQESLRRTPRRGSNPGDPASSATKVTKEPDYDAVVAGFRRTSI